MSWFADAGFVALVLLSFVLLALVAAGMDRL